MIVHDTAFAYVLLILRFISFVLCASIYIALFRNLSNTNDHPEPTIKYATYSALFLLLISMMTSTFHIGIYLFISPDKYYEFTIFETCSNIYYLCWSWSQTLYQIVFVLRLYYGFRGTKYQSPRFVYIAFIGMELLFCISAVWEIIYNFHSYDVSSESDDDSNVYSLSELDTFEMVYAYGSQGIEIIICGFLIVIFLWTLVSVANDLTIDDDIFYQRDYTHNKSSSIPSSPNSQSLRPSSPTQRVQENIYDHLSSHIRKLNYIQRYLLEQMTRIFVLSIFTITLSQITAVLFALSWIVSVYNATAGMVIFHIFHILLPFDCVVQSICLFLNFESTHKWYEKANLCRAGHICLLQCLKRCAKPAEQRKQEESESDNQTASWFPTTATRTKSGSVSTPRYKSSKRLANLKTSLLSDESDSRL